MSDGQELAIRLLTDLMAASTGGNFAKNRERIAAAPGKSNEEKQIEIITRLLSIAERRGMRLAMRAVERTIRRMA